MIVRAFDKLPKCEFYSAVLIKANDQMGPPSTPPLFQTGSHQVQEGKSIRSHLDTAEVFWLILKVSHNTVSSLP